MAPFNAGIAAPPVAQVIATPTPIAIAPIAIFPTLVLATFFIVSAHFFAFSFTQIPHLNL